MKTKKQRWLCCSFSHSWMRGNVPLTPRHTRVDVQGLLYFCGLLGWRSVEVSNKAVVEVMDPLGISQSFRRWSWRAGDEKSGWLLYLEDIFIFLHLLPLPLSEELKPFSSAFRLNTCETGICQVDFLKKAEVSSIIKISLFFIQYLTPAVLLVLSFVSLAPDLNFSSPLRSSAETWYKCKAKRIWDWSGTHFFGQSNSCCLPFTGSQNHGGTLPESQCLDNSAWVCECVHVRERERGREFAPLMCDSVKVYSPSLCLCLGVCLWFLSHACISMCVGEEGPSCQHLLYLKNCCDSDDERWCLLLLLWFDPMS